MTPTREKALVAAVLAVVMPAAFFWTAGLTEAGATAGAWPETGLDRWLPICPAAVWMYATWYPATAVVAWTSVTDFRRGYRAYVLGFATCLLCYATVPASILRPTVEHAGVSAWALDFLYRHDPPVNLFPSFHATVVAIVHGLRSRFPFPSVVTTVWALGVCVACVITKQHYVIDVVAGFALGTVCLRLASRERRVTNDPIRLADEARHGGDPMKTTSGNRRSRATGYTSAVMLIAFSVLLAGCPFDSGSPYGVIQPDGSSPGLGKAAGFKWARVFVHWKDVEKSRGVFDWGGIPDYVKDLKAQGFSILMVFNQMPDWVFEGVPAGITCDAPVEGSVNRPPITKDFMYEFANEAGRVFADYVAAWEPWNEPDACRHFRGTKEQFRTLIFEPAFDGLKAANPGFVVGGPALAGAATPNEFRKWLHGDDGYLTRPVDFISSHAFGYPSEIIDEISDGEQYLDSDTGGLWKRPLDGQVVFTPTRGYWLTAFSMFNGGTEDVCQYGHYTADVGDGYKKVEDACWSKEWCAKTFYFFLGGKGSDWYDKDCDVRIVKPSGDPKPRYYDMQQYHADHPGRRYGDY